MDWVRRARRRLRVFFRLEEVEAELTAELRSHLELEAGDLVRAGMSPAEAERQARLRFGGEERIKEEVRDHRGGRLLADLAQDVRYAMRGLWKAPGFTAAAVSTLALGIGATTAIFSLVYGVLLAPLPYPEPDRLVHLFETSPQGDSRNVVSPGNVVDWRERARSFTALGAYTFAGSATLADDGEPSRVRLGTIHPDVLRAMGIAPTLGRTFSDEDTETGDFVLISHALWQARWDLDPEVLGRRLVLDDIPYTVVGVMPPDFAFPLEDEEVELWRPLRRESLDPTSRTSHYLGVVARLSPSVTLESAQAEMDDIARQIAREHPSEMTGWGVRVVPMRDDVTRDVASLFWFLLGGVGLVLIISCANVANLLLARSVSRQSEMALRGVLGAPRGRVLRQLLTEGAMLAALGCAVGFALAPIFLDALVRAAPPDVPLLAFARIDLRMLGFAAAVGVACALLFGLAPGLRLGRSDLSTSLRQGRGTSIRGQLEIRGGLLAAQVALSVVLLVGAGLFVRSFREIQAVELGFEANGLVLMDVEIPETRYPELSDQASFFRRLEEEVENIPGVSAVTASSQPLGSSSVMTMSFAIEGRVASNPSGREDPEALHAVSPAYFGTIGQRVVDGRAFESGDRADGAPVVIVNEALVRKQFADGSAVGSRIAFRVGETPWLEIVGVVEDTRLQSPDVAPVPTLYIPLEQSPYPWLTWMTIAARVPGERDPLTIAGEMRAAILALDPTLAPSDIRTVDGSFRENLSQRTFALTLISSFALVSLLLVLVGLYGLVTYSVARERREIGVRIALGADSRRIVLRIVRRSLVLTSMGIAGGLLAAGAGSRVVAAFLYGISPLDVESYLVAGALMVLVAVGTAAIPALRAAATDPLMAMRSE